MREAWIKERKIFEVRALPSPLEGEGGSARSAETDEG
jgi:hypothetical protein